MKSSPWRSCALLLGCALASMPAAAHKESDAYLMLSADPTDRHVLKGQWDIALRDLDFALGLDGNHDGAITWGEVRTRRGVIERYALTRLAIRGDGLTCALRPTDQKIDEHTDGAYDVILFDATCDKEVPGRLEVVYRLFDDLDPYHRGILTIHVDGLTSGAVLGPENPEATLELAKPDRWAQFRSFVSDGIWHIWTGPDHLLFILALLLPAVTTRRSGERSLIASAWPVFLDILKVISAFTLSHSVTLTLSVLGIVVLPSRLVESGIALSIIVAAANNLYPILGQRPWVIAFAFGFVHGLGFASALSGLQLPPLAMAASLGGFNAGVEIGQEAIVLLVVPLVFLMSRTRFYRHAVLQWGSLAVIALAGAWLVQRAFDVSLPVLGAQS